MTWIELAAYPRLPRAISLKELREAFAPGDDEMAWASAPTPAPPKATTPRPSTCPPQTADQRKQHGVSRFRLIRSLPVRRAGRGRTWQAPGLVPRCCADGYEGGADAGCDAGVLADAEPDPDEGGVDEGGAADDDVLADADDVGVEDVVGVGEVVGVADVVGVAVWCTVGDEYVLAGWDDVPVYGAGLAGEDALGEADGGVDAGSCGFVDAGAVAGDVCAAGCSIWTGAWLMELTTKAVAPAAPTMPPRISASTSGFIRRRRGGWTPGTGGGAGGGYAPMGGVGGAPPAVAVSGAAAAGGQLPGVGACGPDGPEPAAAVRVAPGPAGGGPVGGTAGGAYAGAVPASAGSDAATAAPAAAATGPDQANPGRDGVPLNVRVSDPGSQSPPGCSAPTSASRPLAVGRCLGSLARQRSISGRIVAGTPSRLGVPCTTRYSRAAVVPVPNGPSPVAANASTAPSVKMSLGGPTS